MAEPLHKAWARPLPVRGIRGHLLVEWMVAAALGLMVGAAALAVFAHQARLLRQAVLQHARVDERQSLAQVLRMEIRMAGQRQQPGPSPAHDRLTLQAGAEPSLHYLCDICGSPDTARRSGFRLRDSTLAHRSLGATAHQALHDPRVLSLQQWVLNQGHTADCSPWVLSRLMPTDAAQRPLLVVVRPRNTGLLPCEAASGP